VERKADLHLEIAHVLFMDVVGFSKLLINDQSEILEQLNQLVRETPHFREAEAGGKLIRLTTGDYLDRRRAHVFVANLAPLTFLTRKIANY
jgi:hypothetical protein